MSNRNPAPQKETGDSSSTPVTTAKRSPKGNELAQFIERFKDSITKKITDTYTPLYRPSDNTSPLPEILRPPMGKQEDAIQGAVISLKSNKGTTIVGEMGTGKTFIGATAAHMAGFQRVLVLCPPHLVQKWKREVENTIPEVNAAIVTSITDLKRIRYIPGDRPLFIIMSRERAKLSYRWKAAYRLTRATEYGRLIYSDLTGEIHYLVACPACNATVKDKDGIPVVPSVLHRKRLFCKECSGALWQADRDGPKRYPLADYVKRYMKGFFQLFIADEVHEYKGKGSAQGIAAGILAESCEKTLTLTGTLMGGYSSTLFHMLYRFSPDIRTEFQHNEEQRWIERYGFLERVMKNEDPDDVEHGRQSRRKGYRTLVREKPGITPAALFHIIGNTVFLRLADVATALPPYQEVIQLSRMTANTDHTGFSQHSAYEYIYENLKTLLNAELARGSKRLLSTYLQVLLAYPDGCTRGETVLDPDSHEVLIQMPPLDSGVTYPKEQDLINLVKQESLQGRRVLVYVTHTASRDITPRLSEMLERNSLRTHVLKADTVTPERREAWVADKVQQGTDVIICHPRLVQTGLDLVDFPTIAWYETDYSVYTMRQASRRSWRIGQTLPVKVVFMGYHETIHTAALKLIAQKLQSSLAVEGELPDEGLITFQNDQEDMILSLARKIANDETYEDDAYTDDLKDVETDVEADVEADVETEFARARDAEAEAEDLLVDDEWRIPEPAAPQPEPATPLQPAPQPPQHHTQPAEPVPQPGPLPEPAASTAHKQEHEQEPEPVPARIADPLPAPALAGAAQPMQPTLLSWDELLTMPDTPRKRPRRKPKPDPSSQSLFDWALGLPQDTQGKDHQA